MLLSGTASGVIGAAWLARQAGEAQILTLDIGGTSADFALIIDGEAQFGTGELIGEFPLHIPSVSVSSIGIGGGSIATVDAQGVLRVGPEMRRARCPGPACYGRGGDAGDGDRRHGRSAAGSATRRWPMASCSMDAAPGPAPRSARLAARLGRGVEETAQAILDVAVSEMFVEVEKLASRAGVDLRDFTLMPFGGGGPMLGAFLARELGHARGSSRRAVPAWSRRSAGWSPTCAAISSAPSIADLDADAPAAAARGTSQALARARAEPGSRRRAMPAPPMLRLSGRHALCRAELRDRGGAASPDWLADRDAPIARAFHATHRRLYDFDDPTGRIELVNLRLSAIGAGPAA